MSKSPDYTSVAANKLRPVLSSLNIKQYIPTGAAQGYRNYTNAKLASRARRWDRMHAPLKVADVLAKPSLAAEHKRKANEIDVAKGIVKDKNGNYESEGDITGDEKKTKKRKKTDLDERSYSDDSDGEKSSKKKKKKVAPRKIQKITPRKKQKAHPHPGSNDGDTDESDENDKRKKKVASGPPPKKQKVVSREKQVPHPAPQSNGTDGETEAKKDCDAPSANDKTKSLLAESITRKHKQASGAADSTKTLPSQFKPKQPPDVSGEVSLLPQPFKPPKMQPTTQNERGMKRKASDLPRGHMPVRPESNNTAPSQMSEAEIDQLMGDMRIKMPHLFQTNVHLAAWRAYLAAGPPEMRRNQAGEFNSDASRKRFRVSPPSLYKTVRMVQAIHNLSAAVSGLAFDSDSLVNAHRRIAEGKELWSSKLLLAPAEGILKSVKLVDWLMDSTGMTREEVGNYLQGGEMLNEDGTPAVMKSTGFVGRDDADGTRTLTTSEVDAGIGEGSVNNTAKPPVRAKELKGREARIEKHKNRIQKVTDNFRQEEKKVTRGLVVEQPEPFWLDKFPELKGPYWQDW